VSISTERPITHLRHVGLAVPNYAEAAEFYGTTWGLVPVANDSGVTFFATPANPEQFVIRVREAAEKRLDLIAFGVATRADVDALAEQLIAASVRIDREPGTLDTPGGGYGVRFFDPDGRLIEVSAEVQERSFRTLEPTESIPRKLSHVVVNSENVLVTKAFYENLLGFRLSDWLDDRMCFMRVNAEHHSLAIAHGPHTALNHVSFEMRGIDEYMRGTGRMIRAGHTLLWGPGRRGAGDNTFSYFNDVSGNVIEYTTELELIVDEDAWQPRVWESTREQSDHWGTANDITEHLIPAMFNEPDPGVWQSSPI